MAEICSATAANLTRRPSVIAPIVGTVSFTFVTYLAIGLSLAVLPGFVHGRLGFGTMHQHAIPGHLAQPSPGRPHGRLARTQAHLLTGLSLCAASGGLLLLGALLWRQPIFSLGVILLARLALGCAESLATPYAKAKLDMIKHGRFDAQMALA